MNKAELVSVVTTKSNLTKADATRAINALVETITEAVSDGNDVTIIGFGTFKRTERTARKGHNPSTGEPMDIPARKSPAFKAGKSFKDAVNK